MLITFLLTPLPRRCRLALGYHSAYFFSAINIMFLFRMRLSLAREFKVILLGAPGSGKGTLASLITKKYPQLNHKSSGELLRAQIEKGTDLGIKAKDFMKQGKLVPDDLVSDVALAELDFHILLDGFPRTISQAKMLHSKTQIDAVINLDVSIDVIQVKRVVSKRPKIENLNFFEIKKNLL